ncbi:MAG: manganese efflux pump [Clostridia bacterium]|nr:manganese efflux pump [Clostridia bacterium]
MGFHFFFTNILLGVGLAMDAFSVSLANGLANHTMKWRRVLLIAGTFALFQALMPFAGWLCVHTLAEQFEAFGKFIPWIALLLLTFIGGKMLLEGVKACRAGLCDDESVVAKFSLAALLVQGIATSIDALSVGFTIAEYNVWQALLAVTLIAAVTFLICMCGVLIGKKFGAGLSGKATILGGSILVVIGIYIFIKGIVC